MLGVVPLNKQQWLKRCYETLIDLNVHPECMGEIIQLIHKTGVEQRFLSILRRRLKALAEHREKVVLYEPENFESIKKVSDIYSMHIVANQLNLRVLFSFSKQGELLLHTFYERSGKKNSSYEAHLPIAKERLKQMLSEEREQNE